MSEKSKNYITPDGAEKLKLELKTLLHQERPELVKVISWAASNGDRSENGDYIYGKRKLREIDRRIRYLTQRLEAAEVVGATQNQSDRVSFGAFVTVQDEEGLERTYQIVGQDESEPARGKISWASPLAKALLNHKVGDVIQFKNPKGEEELEVLQIHYGK